MGMDTDEEDEFYSRPETTAGDLQAVIQEGQEAREEEKKQDVVQTHGKGKKTSGGSKGKKGGLRKKAQIKQSVQTNPAKATKSLCLSIEKEKHHGIHSGSSDAARRVAKTERKGERVIPKFKREKSKA